MNGLKRLVSCWIAQQKISSLIMYNCPAQAFNNYNTLVLILKTGHSILLLLSNVRAITTNEIR